MSACRRSLFLGLILIVSASTNGSAIFLDGPFKKVSDLLEAHDRSLVRDLIAHVEANPKAADLDQAFMALFEKIIEHDWFLDYEKPARTYLLERPDGAVRPLAQIVATMARAQDGKFAEAKAEFKILMKGLDQEEQQQFASNFADSLASAASVAGEFQVAREVYEALLDRYGDNAPLRAKVKDDLARLDMVGKPAPNIPVRDRSGVVFRISDFKGKYVLVDFWATWCAPCVADLPNLEATYKEFHDRGFEIVSISLDETTTPLNDFLKTHQIPWKKIHNATSGGDLVAAFGVNTIPASFLIDPKGTVVRLDLRGPTLKKVLQELIR